MVLCRILSMFTPLIHASLLMFMLSWAADLYAGGVYQEPEAFIAEAFDSDPPQADVLWLKKDLRARIEEILQHKYKGFRVRYWSRDKRSAWILEEIGKEKPITTGFVINDGRVEKVRILIFRESRGWEVRYDFFTRQFDSAALVADDRLDKDIDNVSGATMSVSAVTKLARIALLLHDEINRS